MKTMKRMAIGALALGLVFTAGCKRHSLKETYILVTNNVNLPYWQTAANGFIQAGTQLGVTASVVGPETYDAQGELAALKQAVAKKPSGILISVPDVSVLQPEINAAINAGIPVVTMDSDAPGSKRLFFIGTNNLEAGRLGGRRLITLMGGHGNVVFFTQSGQTNTEERLKGFKDILDTRPDVHIVDVVDIKGDPRVAFDKAQQYLALTGAKKIDALVCLEASSGRQVAEVVRRMKAEDRAVITWDVDPDVLNAIKTGEVDATIAQKPYTMGYYGLKVLDEIYHDPPKTLDEDFAADPFSPYPSFIDTGSALVDKENVDHYLAAAAQHK
jgi:ribose transport system substrate-binding protein